MLALYVDEPARFIDAVSAAVKKLAATTSAAAIAETPSGSSVMIGRSR